jgi:hypothetical protein
MKLRSFVAVIVLLPMLTACIVEEPRGRGYYDRPGVYGGGYWDHNRDDHDWDHGHDDHVDDGYHGRGYR